MNLHRFIQEQLEIIYNILLNVTDIAQGRVSDTGLNPSIRYVILRILGYGDTVLVLDTDTGIREN